MFLRSFRSGLKNIFVIPLPLCEGRVQPLVVKGEVCLPHLCWWKSVSHPFFSFPVVPHITDAIQEWVMRQALIPVDEDGLEPQVCVIEVGISLF